MSRLTEKELLYKKHKESKIDWGKLKLLVSEYELDSFKEDFDIGNFQTVYDLYYSIKFKDIYNDFFSVTSMLSHDSDGKEIIQFILKNFIDSLYTKSYTFNTLCEVNEEIDSIMDEYLSELKTNSGLVKDNVSKQIIGLFKLINGREGKHD